MTIFTSGTAEKHEYYIGASGLARVAGATREARVILTATIFLYHHNTALVHWLHPCPHPALMTSRASPSPAGLQENHFGDRAKRHLPGASSALSGGAANLPAAGLPLPAASSLSGSRASPPGSRLTSCAGVISPESSESRTSQEVAIFRPMITCTCTPAHDRPRKAPCAAELHDKGREKRAPVRGRGPPTIFWR